MAKEYKLSPERLQELEAELNYLKTDRDKQVTEMIKTARGYGDLSENSEYDDAKNEQAKLYARIVKNIFEKVEITYELVGSQEANPMKGRISDDSPLGRAVLGRSVGERFMVEAPMGTIEYEVISISR